MRLVSVTDAVVPPNNDRSSSMVMQRVGCRWEPSVMGARLLLRISPPLRIWQNPPPVEWIM